MEKSVVFSLQRRVRGFMKSMGLRLCVRIIILCNSMDGGRSRLSIIP